MDREHAQSLAVIGATGKTGGYVVTALCDAGYRVVATGRDPGRLAMLDARAARAVIDVTHAAALRGFLADMRLAVSLVPPWHVADVLAAASPASTRLVVANSIRRYSRLTDMHAESARLAAHAFAAWGAHGIMLNLAMIYGYPADANVNHVLQWLRRWPRVLPLVVPLPDGGMASLQPLFLDDMVASVVAAVGRPELDGLSFDVAGARPLTYAAFVRACAAAIGRTARIIAVPSGAMAGILGRLERGGLRPPITTAQLGRAFEDKIIDIAALRARLGVEPLEFEAGLRRALARG